MSHFQVHNIMDQGYECTECGYKSRHRSHLKDHINAMHLEAKFKCDLCDYETKYKNRIKSHRVAVHKIGGLPCPSCDYLASEPWVLSQHVKFMHKWVLSICDDAMHRIFGPSFGFLVFG